MSLKSKQIIYKIKDSKGKSNVAKGSLDFLEAKYKEPKHPKEYNFERFLSGVNTNPDKKKFVSKLRGNFAAATGNNDVSNIDGENDPIQNSTDSKYFLDNDDAIIFDLNRKKDNNS